MLSVSIAKEYGAAVNLTVSVSLSLSSGGRINLCIAIQ